ncbi:ATP-binding protein [Streptomyces sp. SID12488]|uniref:ATP-binding protein n=1 Tax=Streptomyces sp. SID12488 TaxID=2706040 RepID=UPI0013DBC45C|nr:ATP-binding protein [Streptomyces sp. SID12488]
MAPNSTDKDGPAVLTGTTTSGDESRELPSFTEQFASSPRGARLARHLAVRRMEEWGHPSASDASCAVALVVGELAANAVRHGRIAGRDFGLRLVLDTAAGLVRVEVADAASAKRPPTATPSSYPVGESGRGLLLVDVLAVRWGWAPRQPVGKTVWADVQIETRAQTVNDGGPAAAGPLVVPSHTSAPAEVGEYGRRPAVS